MRLWLGFGNCRMRPGCRIPVVFSVKDALRTSGFMVTADDGLAPAVEMEFCGGRNDARSDDNRISAGHTPRNGRGRGGRGLEATTHHDLQAKIQQLRVVERHAGGVGQDRHRVHHLPP